MFLDKYCWQKKMEEQEILSLKRLLEINQNFSLLLTLFVVYLCHCYISVSIESCKNIDVWRKKNK